MARRPAPKPKKQSCQAIAKALSRWKGHIGDFVEQLDKDSVSFLSYSKVASVETCEYGYFLEYIEGVEQEEPHYFAKGRIFHDVAAQAHRQLADGRSDLKALRKMVNKHCAGDDRAHLLNAARLLMNNGHQGYEVIATELPFVLSLGNRLPPLIGVIDLLLRKGRTFLVVDHKTGKNFYEQDELQLHLYREHVRRAFKPTRCLACFDEYRWVNDLESIRKPAFRRTPVKAKPWESTLGRISLAYEAIRRIHKTGDAAGEDKCFACHLKDVCPKVTFGNHWG